VVDRVVSASGLGALPGMELRLAEDQTEALLSALAAGQLDLAVIGLRRYDRSPPAYLSPAAYETAHASSTDTLATAA
jgi:hypothetical protein